MRLAQWLFTAMLISMASKSCVSTAFGSETSRFLEKYPHSEAAQCFDHVNSEFKLVGPTHKSYQVEIAKCFKEIENDCEPEHVGDDNQLMSDCDRVTKR